VIVSFLTYSWPGNIRELRNVIERAIALTGRDLVQVSALPESIRGSGTLDNSNRLGEMRYACDSRLISNDPRGEEGLVPKRWSRLEAIQAAERDYLIDLMKRYNGNVSEAARHADVSRQGMHKLLKSHSIRPAEFRSL
jgi:transcriptional regulator of acetoin/glycerol metabolism